MARWEDHLPAIAMVALQFVSATNALLNRAALLKGMSPMIFIVYRQAIAAAVTFPVSYITSRKSRKAAMSIRSFVLIFVTAFIGVVLSQFVYYKGLYLASSSMASATSNLTPAVTFIIAAFLGFEQLNLRRLGSVAKIAGTLVCVGGAVTMALLRGPKILNAQLPPLPEPNVLHALSQGDYRDDQAWLLGCLFLFASMVFWSFWLILQVPITACYPDPLSLSAWMSLLAMLQAGLVGFFTESDPDAWVLSSPIELACCLFSGIVGSGVQFFVQAWCISRKGPFFSSMFSPLLTVITAVLACIFLHEELYLGSLLGAIAVIVGLYIVLWGKAEERKLTIEEKKSINPGNTDSKNDLEQPLLVENSGIETAN